MTLDTKELQRCIGVLETHLPSIYDNPYSKAICHITLLLAKKYRDESSNIVVEEKEVPDHFVAFANFCNDHAWAESTVRNNLEAIKKNGYKYLSKIKKKKGSSGHWYVDAIKILELLATKGVKSRMRMKARRGLQMVYRFKKLAEEEKAFLEKKKLIDGSH